MKSSSAIHDAWVALPAHFPAQGDLIAWCQNMSPGVAALLVFAGVVYLLWGWMLFKGLVLLNAAIIGGFIGTLIGQKCDGAGVGALLGAFVAGALTWAMMRYAVAVMGGLVGALLGATIWRSAGLDANLAWAGAMMGLIAFGMLSFILFKGSVMMYMSLQGAAMLIFGVLGLVFKYPSVAEQLTQNMTGKPFILPIAVFIPMLVGLIYQQTNAAPVSAPAAAGAAKK